MKAFELLDAMTDISNEQIQSAQQRLGYEPQQPTPRRPIRLKRLLFLSAAILAIMAAMLATAMAVNTDFRAFVFDILRMEQPHIIEDPALDAPLTAENMYVESPMIGDPIQARRIHTPVSAMPGTAFSCSAPMRSRCAKAAAMTLTMSRTEN